MEYELYLYCTSMGTFVIFLIILYHFLGNEQKPLTLNSEQAVGKKNIVYLKQSIIQQEIINNSTYFKNGKRKSKVDFFPMERFFCLYFTHMETSFDKSPKGSNQSLPQNIIDKLADINSLSSEILKDLQLKKGKKAKFIKHLEKLNELTKNVKLTTERKDIIYLAGLYKNLGKLGEHEETLQKAVSLISDLNQFKPTAARWLLQIAALKSPKKQHEECFQITQQVIKMCKQILIDQLNTAKSDKQVLFLQKLIEIVEEKTKDEIVWIINEKSVAEELLYQIKKNSKVQIPFYPLQQFHISDCMTLDQCSQNWSVKAIENPIKSTIKYLSISFFTMATEKFYSQDYSYKYCHLKSLKIALYAFDINCSYVSFLLKILYQHFGKRLQSIQEEHFENAERFEMRRILPKDPKEVSAKYLQLAQ